MKLVSFCAAFVTLIALASARPFHAAKCIALGQQCGRVLSRRSGRCNPFTAARSQSSDCFARACGFCREDPDRFSRFPCKNPSVKSACYEKTSMPNMPPMPDMNPMQPAPMPTRAPQPHRMDTSRCTYMGDDKVVIDLGRIELTSGWTRMKRDGMSGIIFDEGSKSQKIIPAGTRGTICFNLKLRQGGQYYTTAISSSPDNTEHNDVWIKSSKGFRLFKEGNFRPRTGSWLKGFQNLGHNRIADMLKTVDHNGHYLVTDVDDNERFEICISGRSTLFEMFKLVLVPCEGRNCGPKDVADHLESLPPTQCM